MQLQIAVTSVTNTPGSFEPNVIAKLQKYLLAL